MEPGEEDLVVAVEAASDRLLEPLGIWPLPPSTPEAKSAEEARTLITLVAGRPPVGFARLELVDGHTHVGQLSVLPEYGRLGIGASLMEASCRWAAERGDCIITLTTFVDVPFNAPWYRRLGFEELPEPHEAELSRAVADERELAELSPRVVMGRVLGR
jgi:GNAT superfamily N-acetyltransferase